MLSGIDKTTLVRLIVEKLSANLSIVSNAAKAAQEAATAEENIADNKYDTLSLEASYLAQGQTNRANDIRYAIDAYRSLSIQRFDADEPIGVTALVILEAEDGDQMTVFLGPQAGGLTLVTNGHEVVIVSPSSPLGAGLTGKAIGDTVELHIDEAKREAEIVEVC